MNKHAWSRARRAFEKMELRLIDVGVLADYFDEVQASIALSLHENFARLPDIGTPAYSDAAHAALESYCEFVNARMQGMITEIEKIKESACVNIEIIKVREEQPKKKKKRLRSSGAQSLHERAQPDGPM